MAIENPNSKREQEVHQVENGTQLQGYGGGILTAPDAPKVILGNKETNDCGNMLLEAMGQCL